MTVILCLKQDFHFEVPPLFSVVLLLKAAAKWRELREGLGSSAVVTPGSSVGATSCCTSKDRAQLKEIISGMRRQHPEGIPTDVSFLNVRK
jgi:hypothetical protein